MSVRHCCCDTHYLFRSWCWEIASSPPLAVTSNCPMQPRPCLLLHPRVANTYTGMAPVNADWISILQGGRKGRDSHLDCNRLVIHGPLMHSPLFVCFVCHKRSFMTVTMVSKESKFDFACIALCLGGREKVLPSVKTRFNIGGVCCHFT